LGLKPWEFDRLTPGEFADILEGFNTRQEMEYQRTAWLAANLMNLHLKRKITPAKLLGKKPKRDTRTKEEKRRELEAVKRLFGEVK